MTVSLEQPLIPDARADALDLDDDFERCTAYDATKQWASLRAVAVSVAGVLQVEAGAPSWVREALQPPWLRARGADGARR
jgi:hypothetical protein